MQDRTNCSSMFRLAGQGGRLPHTLRTKNTVPMSHDAALSAAAACRTRTRLVWCRSTSRWCWCTKGQTQQALRPPMTHPSCWAGGQLLPSGRGRCCCCACLSGREHTGIALHRAHATLLTCLACTMTWLPLLCLSAAPADCPNTTGCRPSLCRLCPRCCGQAGCCGSAYEVAGSASAPLMAAQQGRTWPMRGQPTSGVAGLTSSARYCSNGRHGGSLCSWLT